MATPRFGPWTRHRARGKECHAVTGWEGELKDCDMEQRSKPDGEKFEALLHGLDARDTIALEVMREVFARLPYGQEFRLSDGSVARLEKLFDPELCANQHSENYERPWFGVDVAIE